MAIGDDFSIDTSRNIRYIGAAHGDVNAGYYTVLEIYRWAQDLADNAQASGDDILAATYAVPGRRQTDNIIEFINGYNIDQLASEHLYNGSIIQSGGDERWDGFQVIAGGDMFLMIHQNGAVLANDFWNNNAPGSVEAGLNPNAAQGLAMQFMLKVRDGGSDIDGRRIIGLHRTAGKAYAEFPVNGSNPGNNPIALSNVNDLNDSGTGTVGLNVTNTEGYQLVDINNDSTGEQYYAQIALNGDATNDAYERFKYLIRRGETTPIYGLPGELFRGVTHFTPLTGPSSGTFNAVEPISWPTGTGQLLAIDDTDPSSATQLWLQLLTGTAPVTGELITGGTSGATVTALADSESEPTSVNWIGQSTGSAIIAAKGIAFNPADTTASDTFTDLDGNTITPPNFVSFGVGGLVIGEDYVVVGPESGGALQKTQFQTNAATVAAQGTLEIVAQDENPGAGQPAQTDTPQSGTLRLVGDDGIDYLVSYTGYTTGGTSITFTGCTGIPTTAAAGNNVFLTYIDTLAGATTETYGAVFGGNRALFVSVRDGGGSPIVPFETPASLTAAGGSVTAIRNSDA